MNSQLLNKIFKNYLHYIIVGSSILFIFIIVSFYKSYKQSELIYLEKTLNNIYLNKTLSTFLDNLNPRYETIKYKVQEGDSLEKILNQINISKSEKDLILNNLLKNKQLSKIFKNQEIFIKIDRKKPVTIKEINFTISKTTNIVFKRDYINDIFLTKKIEKNLKKEFSYKE